MGEQIECLNVTNSYRKKREKQQKKENHNDNNKENEENNNRQKKISKIKGIDFVKEVDNLSKLTVVKLRYYTDKNNIDVGRVKKSELVKIIKKDIQTHFDL